MHFELKTQNSVVLYCWDKGERVWLIIERVWVFPFEEMASSGKLKHVSQYFISLARYSISKKPLKCASGRDVSAYLRHQSYKFSSLFTALFLVLHKIAYYMHYALCLTQQYVFPVQKINVLTFDPEIFLGNQKPHIQIFNCIESILL